MENLLAHLEQQVFANAVLTSEEVVDAMIGAWESLAARLVPVIGNEDFRSLLDRSLHLTSIQFPWLAMDLSVWDHSSRFSSLRDSFNSQPSSELALGGLALLTSFVKTLVELIGVPLVSNILRSAWGDHIVQR